MCLSLLLQVGSAAAMPAMMPTDEVKPGMQGWSETVVQGSDKVKFNVEIIGVVDSGKGMPKQILARAYGDVIDKTNGVIHGMSGSPVYIGDKLVGAVARGIGQDVLPYNFYITPIEDMVKLWDMPDPLAYVNKSGIAVLKVPTPDEYKKHQEQKDSDIDKIVEKYKSQELTAKDGEKREKGAAQKRLEEILNGTETQEDKSKNADSAAADDQTDEIIDTISGISDGDNIFPEAKLEEHISMSSFLLNSIRAEERLRSRDAETSAAVPIYAAGFANGSFNYLKHRLAAVNMVPHQAGAFLGNSAGGGDTDVRANAVLSPGDPVGVLMVYGDFSAGGVGTVTAVDGDRVAAFGHPMSYMGNVNYFMSDASIVGSAGGILNGLKVSSFGKLIGRVNQDRYSGVSGILNTYPASVPVRVHVKDKNLGTENSFAVKIAYDEDILPAMVPTVIYAAMERTADRSVFGSANVKFTIMTDEMPEGKFVRENMFYDAKDVGQFAVGELGQAMYYLSTNIDKPSNILDVKVDVEMNSGRNTASIISATPDKEEAKPGDKVNINVMLKPYRREAVPLTIPYTIPKTQPEGTMNLEVKGGGFIKVAQLLNSALVNTPDTAGQFKTVDRLNDLQNLDKNNEIVVSPAVDLDASEADTKKAIEAAVKLSDELAKMTPREREAFNNERESKISTEYVIDNYVQTQIKIKK